MKVFASHLEQIDEMTKYGFELALRYAELAVEYNKDPIEFLKETLAEWKEIK